MKLVGVVLCCLMPALARAQALPRFDGERALTYTREFVATGPRWVGSKGHAKAQAFLERQFAKDDLVKDSFTASTPAGPLAMTNYIVKFPGTKDGIIRVFLRSPFFPSMVGSPPFVDSFF